MKTFNTAAGDGAQDPQEFLTRFSRLSEGMAQAFQAPARAAVPPGEGGGNTHLMMSFMQFQQQTMSQINEMVLAMDLKNRDNKALAAEVDRLEALREKNETSLSEYVNQITTVKNDHATALNSIATERAAEKKDLEGQLAAVTTELEAVKTELEEAKKAGETLKQKVADLEAENAELNERVVKLGGEKKGLKKPDAEKKEETSTEKGDPKQPTKDMTLGEAAALGEGASSEDIAMAGLLKEFVQLEYKAQNGGRDKRLFNAYYNDAHCGATIAMFSEIAECEACKTDPKHHYKLINKAISLREKLQGISVAAN